MKILVTGHEGYIGTVLVPMLLQAGHDVTGLDSGLYRHCTLREEPAETPSLQMDLRDVEVEHLAGFDAVIHLAALSNDPLGNLDTGCTYQINHAASVRLARLAKLAHIPRFLFASSCSLYGAAAGESALDEQAAFNPVTPYGRTKIMVEHDVALLADKAFTPTYLRCATAYGYSPRLRMDIVVNELVARACKTGVILLMSDGTPWRPLVHVEDIALAYLALLDAPRDVVQNQAFNVGITSENYRIAEVAEVVRAAVPGSRIEYADGASGDARCYRVNFDKLARQVPAFQPRWNLRQGVRQLLEAYRLAELTEEDIVGPRYRRLGTLKQLLARGEIDDSLRRIPAGLACAG